MHENLFNETFFKKNNYFRKELNISKDQIKDIQSLIKNWQKNCESFNPDVDKETTDENEFVDILFKKILGYSGKGKDADNYNILPKFKIDGASSTGKAGFADLALGNFSKNKTDAEVVIEFKGQNSDDLTKTSNRPDKLSPVDQCWKYLLNHPAAKWGIVTNFNEIRIYNKEKGQNVYETFYFNVPAEYKDKFQPLSTETEILKLITILKKENLLSANGISQTEELLKNKGVEETKVQKEFYFAYKSLRSQIFYEALKHNPQYESERPKSELLQLVQKFLDRIIFCWFCEDSREHLIPSNVLSADLIQTQTKDKYYNPQHFSIYGKVKDLFQAIDEGRAFGIDSGYNGELFKPDAALDALKLPNFLFEKIAEIGMQYDFGDENELNVNILGHIFEQSISDLEEMRVSFQELDQTPRKIEKQHVMEFAKEVDVLEHKHTEFDAKKTKRKKEGVFYTPDYITRYIVENTVGVWLKDKEAEVTKKYSSLKKNKEYTILREYRDEHLSKIKILDPACGSGAFLIAAFNYLWKEHERVYTEIKEIKNKTAQGELFDFDSINKTILENNLYGVDLNRESVEITKLALWLKTAAKNKKLNSLHNNIKCGNSLIDDKSVAGELAFDWKKEFSSIMKAEGFDVIVGNPPYVRADSSGNSIEFRNYMVNNNTYKTLAGKWDIYIAFIEKSMHVLKKLGYASLIIPDSYCHANYAETSRSFLIEHHYLKQIDYFPGIELFESVGVRNVIIHIKKAVNEKFKQRIFSSTDTYTEKIFPSVPDSLRVDSKESLLVEQKNNVTLSNICYISVGIVGNSHEDKYKGEFEVKDLLSDSKDSIHSKIYIEGKDIDKWVLKSKNWIEYGTERSPSKWRRKGFLEFFEGAPKIITMRSPGYNPKSILDEDSMYFNESAIAFKRWIDLKDVDNVSLKKTYVSDDKRQEYTELSEKFSIKFILVILNSKLIKYELNKNRRSNIHIYPDDWKEIPIKKISPKDQKPFIRLADIMLTKNKELQEIQKKFTTLLVSEFKIEKLTEKLEDWYLLDWSEFANELKKKKTVLSARDEEKWLDRFERLKKEALAIKGVIDSTDKEIDGLVYELYGLTEEEIQIVEGTFAMPRKNEATQ